MTFESEYTNDRQVKAARCRQMIIGLLDGPTRFITEDIRRATR